MVFPEEQLFRKNGSSGRTVFQSLHWQIVTWIKDLCIGFTHWGINFLYPIWEPFFRENRFSGRNVLPEDPFFRKCRSSRRTVLPEEPFFRKNCSSKVCTPKCDSYIKDLWFRVKLSGRMVLPKERFFRKNSSSGRTVLPEEQLFQKMILLAERFFRKNRSSGRTVLPKFVPQSVTLIYRIYG